MITTSFESPKIGKETHYLKMGVGDENIWRTLYKYSRGKNDIYPYNISTMEMRSL